MRHPFDQFSVDVFVVTLAVIRQSQAEIEEIIDRQDLAALAAVEHRLSAYIADHTVSSDQFVRP